MNGSMRFLFVLMMFCFVQPAFATNDVILSVPKCLLNKINMDYQTLATKDNILTIRTNKTNIEKLIAVKSVKSNTVCGGFIDITNKWQNTSIATNTIKPFTKSYAIQYHSQVNSLLQLLQPNTIWNNLAEFTHFPNRYADSEDGLKAADWIQTKIKTMAQDYNRHDIQVYLVQTKSYKQPSVIAKIPGSSNSPAIILSAHMDTLMSKTSKKPGADDDGSGTVVMLETLRALLQSQMTFKKPIYFIWYAAEEEGLVGSQHVVDDFKIKQIPVEGVMHIDLAGYRYRNQQTIWLLDDYTNKNLRQFLELLVTTYIKAPVNHTRCGYACSDHASWTLNGFAAAAPAETSYEDTNPYLHSSLDTMEKLSLDHLTNFARLASAFAVEMGEPINVTTERPSEERYNQ